MEPRAPLACVLAVAATIGAGIAAGPVDCADVVRNLKAGGSAREVADAMGISEADVKDCQDKAEIESTDIPGQEPSVEGGGSDESRKPFWRDEPFDESR
jgi:hypothetical protein